MYTSTGKARISRFLTTSSNRSYNNIGESALLKFISIHVAQNFRTEIVSRALNYLARETYKAFFAN